MGVRKIRFAHTRWSRGISCFSKSLGTKSRHAGCIRNAASTGFELSTAFQLIRGGALTNHSDALRKLDSVSGLTLTAVMLSASRVPRNSPTPFSRLYATMFTKAFANATIASHCAGYEPHHVVARREALTVGDWVLRVRATSVQLSKTRKINSVRDEVMTQSSIFVAISPPIKADWDQPKTKAPPKRGNPDHAN